MFSHPISWQDLCVTGAAAVSLPSFSAIYKIPSQFPRDMAASGSYSILPPGVGLPLQLLSSISGHQRV